ncbi:MAG: ABC transporter substrate-binding protein [Alphaproteobacteria bacterium]|nr:MAG: ABC transporter substrate-binding protein [Alphaproteobacteria bacterium]
MTRRSVLTAAFVLIAAALAPAALAAADPAAVINNLGNRALEVLGKNATPAQRAARFQELFRADFDVPGIARFVLGRYWKTATPEQQEESVKLFEDYIALVYSAQLAAYSGETLKVTGSRPGPEGAIVASEIVRPTGAPPVKVEWHLTDRSGSYKINDVSVDGISMAVTQRSEFAAVIQRSGGQVQGLITQLREKTANSAPR